MSFPIVTPGRPALPDGYTDVPLGKIAAVVTYLEMRSPPPRPAAKRNPGPLSPIEGDLDRYRALYRAIGAPWLWFSRLRLDDAALRAILDDPDVEALILQQAGRDVGLLELDFREPDQCELAFFGLTPEAVGQGTGRALMDEAIARAWSRPIRRFFVHTCTLDHPNAAAFYVRSGFIPYKRAIEIADDPRLMGELPRDAAPHAPVIGG